MVFGSHGKISNAFWGGKIVFFPQKEYHILIIKIIRKKGYTLSNKKKIRKQDLDHAIDEEKEQVLRSYFFPLKIPISATPIGRQFSVQSTAARLLARCQIIENSLNNHTNIDNHIQTNILMRQVSVKGSVTFLFPSNPSLFFNFTST